MQITNLRLAVLVGLASASTWMVGPVRAQVPTIRIDGSSTVYPVTEAVAEEFQAKNRGKVRLTVGISGTGGGFKKFLRGELDIVDASRPISEDEMNACSEKGIGYVELPICFDAITVLVNRRNDWATSITVEELKKIWEPSAQGSVTQWSQIRAGWPSEKIVLYGPGADSGTFDYFTEAVCGTSRASRGDYTASEDDNVLVQGIDGDRFALGYVGLAYYEGNRERVKALAVQWRKNKVETPVSPGIDNVLNATYNPLSRPLFIYVSRTSADRPEVRQFVEFYLAEGATLAKEVGYLPLPDAAYTACLARFDQRQVGTAFGGVPEIGVTIDEVLKRQPVSDSKSAAKTRMAAPPRGAKK
ncbi:MAG: PstS family phosphate ABC transporter substrate-binding protein [Planctomycetota bacterium]